MIHIPIFLRNARLIELHIVLLTCTRKDQLLGIVACSLGHLGIRRDLSR